MATEFDIIIVGGGMVGLATAAALAESSLKILLIEKQPLDEVLPFQRLLQKDASTALADVRVSAISPANRDWLKAINVWQGIPDCLKANYQQMVVWDGDGTGQITFSAAEVAEPNLGVIVENNILQASSLGALETDANIHCQFGQGIDQIEVEESGVEVHLQGGGVYRGKLLIGADGAHSTVRRLLGIGASETDYQQLAFVANVRCEKSHQQTAWQRFTPHGPVAFLPLPDANLCSIVWSIDSDRANSLQGLSNDAFASKLQQAFESRLGQVELVSDYLSFPLMKRHADHYLEERVALIGDAAHTIHPLAGQGVNIGFQDSQCLTDLVLKLNRQGRDFGLKANLRPFERERKTENLVMQNAMSGFKHLFANQSMPITLIRNFAMSAMDKMPTVKQEVIKKAMGF